MAYHEKAVNVIIDGKNKTDNSGKTEIEQARELFKAHGFYAAARFLAKRNWSVEARRYVLIGI